MTFVKPHESGDRVLPGERIATAYFWKDGWAEEMEFIVSPGASDKRVKQVASEWAAENLDPDGWDTLTIGEPSVPIVRL